MSIFDSGDYVRVSAIFTDTAHATGDPSTVWFKWRDPAGSTGSAQYGVDTGLKRLATGVYYYETSLGAPGTFWYRWHSIGTLAGAEEGSFTIRQPRV